MGEVTDMGVCARAEVRTAIAAASDLVDETDAYGIIVILSGPDGVSAVTNDSMSADGAVALLEVVKAMNVRVLLGGEE